MTSTLLWVLLGVAVLAGSAVAAWLVRRGRPSPTERERKRRLEVNGRGRMSDGTLTDYYDNTLMFSYLVRGVSYATSQDVSTLHDYIDDQDFAPGPIIVKYLAGNPANSIVVCEQWSGLRGRHQILKPTQIQETKVT